MVLNIKAVQGTSDVLAIVTEEPLENWLHYGGENINKVRCPKEKRIRADLVFQNWIEKLDLDNIPPKMWWDEHPSDYKPDEEVPF